MSTPRYLAIDFGLKRVGLAVCGPDSDMVFPLKTIVRTTRETFFAELLITIQTENIQAVVIGLPLDLDGNETLITRQAKNFASSLTRRISLPVYQENEALTSFEAKSRLDDAGVYGKKRKKVLDQMAAVAIMESFLTHPTDREPVVRPDQ